MDKPTKIDIKENFERARALLRMSKRAVARKAGMMPGTLDGVLKHNNPKTSQIYQLSKGLGVSVQYLVGGGDPVEELKKNYVFEALEPPKIKKTWSPEMPNVAARATLLLKKKGKTKKSTAKEVGEQPSWWSTIIRKNNPTMATVSKVAFAIGVSPIELMNGVSASEYGRVMMPRVPY